MTSAASTGHDRRSGSNLMLLLSLNLILLAFFILLNSLADFKAERARAVLASVNQAFNGKIDVGGQLPAFGSSLGALPQVDAKMRQVGSLFEAIAPSANAKSIRRANTIRVDLPATALFKPASPRLRQGREASLQRLAQALRKGPKAAPRYLLEVLVGIGTQSAAEGAAPTGSASLELRRAAVLAARLSAEGVPVDGISAGLRPGAPDSLRFILRWRPEPATAAGSNRRQG